MISPRIFVSHASENTPTAHRLALAFRAYGWQTWIDFDSLRPGIWLPQIDHAIGNANTFVLCLSEAAIGKLEDLQTTLAQEFSIARSIARGHPESAFRIVPVRLEPCGRGDLRITTWQQFDLFPDWDAGLARLIAEIRGEVVVEHASTPTQQDAVELIGKLRHEAAKADLCAGKDTTLYILGGLDALGTAAAQLSRRMLLSTLPESSLSRTLPDLTPPTSTIVGPPNASINMAEEFGNVWIVRAADAAYPPAEPSGLDPEHVFVRLERLSGHLAGLIHPIDGTRLHDQAQFTATRGHVNIPLSDGYYRITAYPQDRAGNRGTSVVRVILQDHNPPELSEFRLRTHGSKRVLSGVTRDAIGIGDIQVFASYTSELELVSPRQVVSSYGMLPATSEVSFAKELPNFPDTIGVLGVPGTRQPEAYVCGKVGVLIRDIAGVSLGDPGQIPYSVVAITQNTHARVAVYEPDATDANTDFIRNEITRSAISLVAEELEDEEGATVVRLTARVQPLETGASFDHVQFYSSDPDGRFEWIREVELNLPEPRSNEPMDVSIDWTAPMYREHDGRTVGQVQLWAMGVSGRAGVLSQPAFATEKRGAQDQV